MAKIIFKSGKNLASILEKDSLKNNQKNFFSFFGYLHLLDLIHINLTNSL